MNENETNAVGASDREILDGVRGRLSAVEPMVPAPPDWQPQASARAARGQGSRMNVHIRAAGAFGFGGVVAIMLLAIVIGASMASQGPRPVGGSSPSPYQQWTTILYELQPVNGVEPAATDLDTTVQILTNRVDSTGATGAQVTAQAPNMVTVKVPGVPDLAALEALLGPTGSLEIVLLPPETYGTATAPGARAIPAIGEPIDPTLPAEFTGAQLDSSGIAAKEDPANQGSYVVGFAFKPDAGTEFATWTGQHVNDYIAIVLDGDVLSVPYIFSEIEGGSGEIAGSYTAESADRLAAILRYGQLPFPLKEVSSAVTTPPAPAPATGDGTITPLPSADALASSIVVPTVTTPSDLPSDGRTLGNSNAPVTLDLWGDYRCPACQDFVVQTMPKLISNYVRPGNLKVAYHDLIVVDAQTGSTESRDAADAADAARCAADQGKFWAYTDWLFANQSPTESPEWFTSERLGELANRAGLDATTFESCLAGGRHDDEVAAESAAGTAAGAVGVPAFFIDGAQFDPVGGSAGMSTYDYLASVIDAAIGRSAPAASAIITPAASAGSPALAGPTPTASPTFLSYAAIQGDTLQIIADKFGITLAQLQAANPEIGSGSVIQVGEIVYIPAD